MSQFQKARYKKHLEKTKIMYEKLMIPQYLIVCGNNNVVEEVLTKQQLFSMYSSALGIREVSKEKAEDYFNTSNYSKKINNYFNNKSLSETPFEPTYKFEGYLEGILDNENIKGNFKGKIRIINRKKQIKY